MDINKKRIEYLRQNFQNAERPVYVYFAERVKENYLRLKNCFKGFGILYSIKANPFKDIMQAVADEGGGFDAASAGEVRKASELIKEKEKILYSAPGKSRGEILYAADKAVIIADSLNELMLLGGIAKEQGRTLAAGVRLNTGGITGKKEIMTGSGSKFGISVKELIDFKNNIPSSLSLEYIHVYTASQILDYKEIINNFNNILSAADALRSAGFNIKHINFGGGIGVPYGAGDGRTHKNSSADSQTAIKVAQSREKRGFSSKEVYQNIHDRDESSGFCGYQAPFAQSEFDLESMSEYVLSDKKLNECKSAGVKFYLESGRYVAADAGYFITDVRDIKTSPESGQKTVIVAGLMNNFFRPAFMDDFHSVINLSGGEKTDAENCIIAGNLCTPIDRAITPYFMPLPKIGDRLAFCNAGAYGKTMSMAGFISHEEAGETSVNGI